MMLSLYSESFSVYKGPKFLHALLPVIFLITFFLIYSFSLILFQLLLSTLSELQQHSLSFYHPFPSLFFFFALIVFKHPKYFTYLLLLFISLSRIRTSQDSDFVCFLRHYSPVFYNCSIVIDTYLLGEINNCCSMT